ncbi:hypothetical protein CI610_00942 [invertebrate metagenome]|uniref:Uncharacterized protein n=1 Tax=invertebrate metagenome TaxID=1711999 RepID=A0A2H9TA00_9ZZZZ
MSFKYWLVYRRYVVGSATFSEMKGTVSKGGIQRLYDRDLVSRLGFFNSYGTLKSIQLCFSIFNWIKP